jgi:hypothetical protein
MTATDWVLIITAVFVGIVSVVNAWGTHFGRKEAKAAVQEARDSRHEASGKLDVIHDLTNSSMTALKGELAAALMRIDKLEGMLSDRLRRVDDARQ